MPYGVKRGFKSPGEFGMTDIAGLALAGAAGIVAALVTDYQQGRESSALYTLNRWAVDLGGLFGFTNIPLFSVILAIVAVGAGSVFYFQPITRQGAFAQGFGLLAVIMTAIPSDIGAGIQEIINDENLPGLSASATDTVRVREISYSAPDNHQQSDLKAKVFNAILPGEAPSPQGQAISGVANGAVAAVNAAVTQNERRAAQYRVKMVITFEGGLGAELNSLIRRGLLRGRLHNEDTGQTYNIFRNAGGNLHQEGDKLIIDAGVPARSPSAKLWIRIECDGHQIEIQSAQASLNQQLTWPVTVKKSSTPLFIQRLGKVYWF